MAIAVAVAAVALTAVLVPVVAVYSSTKHTSNRLIAVEYQQ